MSFTKKTMKIIKSLILLASLFSLGEESLKAQIQYVVGSDVILDKLRLNRGIEGEDNLFYDDVQGDPFIFREFHQGTLYVLPDTKASVMVRFDIYADQMHIKDKDQIYAIIHPEKVRLIEAGDYKFIYSAYLASPGDKEAEKSGYFILKVDGKCKLLLKKNIRVQAAEPEKLYQEAKPPKFLSSDDTYFLKIDGNGAIRIRSKKDLLKVLADKSGAIDSYMSSNKLDAKDIKDLVKIITYYNTL